MILQQELVTVRTSFYFALFGDIIIFEERFCFGAFSTNMYYLILLLISHQSHAAITITSVSELMNLDQQHSIVNVNDAHISVDYLRRLIGQKKIHDNNIHQLEISLLESSETTSLLRDDQKWKNVFAGVGHKGMAIPYFNGVKYIYIILRDTMIDRIDTFPDDCRSIGYTIG